MWTINSPMSPLASARKRKKEREREREKERERERRGEVRAKIKFRWMFNRLKPLKHHTKFNITFFLSRFRISSQVITFKLSSVAFDN